jgi:hypothetical protein
LAPVVLPSMASSSKQLYLTDQVDIALKKDLFNLDSLTAQIKSVVSKHEQTQELLVTLQVKEPRAPQQSLCIATLLSLSDLTAHSDRDG